MRFYEEWRGFKPDRFFDVSLTEYKNLGFSVDVNLDIFYILELNVKNESGCS